jgi:hypothetical protein
MDRILFTGCCQREDDPQEKKHLTPAYKIPAEPIYLVSEQKCESIHGYRAPIPSVVVKLRSELEKPSVLSSARFPIIICSLFVFDV